MRTNTKVFSVWTNTQCSNPLDVSFCLSKIPVTINQKKIEINIIFHRHFHQMEPNYKELYLISQTKVQELEDKCDLLRKIISSAFDTRQLLHTCDLCSLPAISDDYTCYRCCSKLCSDCDDESVSCHICGHSFCLACQIYPARILPYVCTYCWKEPECDILFTQKISGSNKIIQ